VAVCVPRLQDHAAWERPAWLDLPQNSARLSRTTAWLDAPVRWIAARPYALYLMYLTIQVDIAGNRLFEPGLLPAYGCVIVAVLLPFPLAELSYRLLEVPLLRLCPRQGRLPAIPI
jgi:peptidoglycan/LPS O-acetylase OafA/YrhL